MRRLGRANKPLETRHRWIGENTTALRIAISGAFPAKELPYQTPLAEAANARICEIRLLD